MENMSNVQCSTVLLIILLSVLMSHSSGAEKVLLVPAHFGAESRWFALAKIGQALVDRGHVVTVVLSEDIVEKRSTQFPAFSYETFQDKGTGKRLAELVDHHLANAGQVPLYKFLQMTIAGAEEGIKHCELLLGDRDLVTRLKTSQYSVVVFDPLLKCQAILAARMNDEVPSVAVLRMDTSFFDIEATGVPVPLSYVPLVTPFTDQMTFLQRVQNDILSTVIPKMFRFIGSISYDGLARKYLGEEETIQSVISRTDLWLYQQDYLLDFPRPSMPNMVYVGGLNVLEVAPISEDLETFFQRSGDAGVVVVSLGSKVKTMSPKKSEIFAKAFARLRQKVVWRYEGEKPKGLGNNTKLLAWLPQNDLLGHPKTRVFVTHVGSNGMYEALHHGVPMVCLPLFSDQPANAARVVARGLGVKLNFDTVTTDQLYQSILHVLTNNSYTENAARLSRLHLDQPESPMQRAVWWIEYAMKHGKLSHLRARAVDLPFYQYRLFDVVAFLLAVCSAVLGTVWCSCSLMCRKCCAKSSGKPKSE